MTYWAREHEHNLRRIGDVMRELEYAYEDIIPALITDLEQDAEGETKASCHLLRLTRSHIATAMNTLTNARDDLPPPQFRPTAYPTAADVMERDA